MTDRSKDGSFNRMRTIGELTFQEVYFGTEGVYRALRSDPPNAEVAVEARFDAEGRLTELLVKQPALHFEVPTRLAETADGDAPAASDLGAQLAQASAQSAATHAAVMAALQQPIMPPKPQF